MFNKFSLNKDQTVIVNQLHKELKVPKDEIVSTLFEIGLSSILGIRKGKIKEVNQSLEDFMSKNETLLRIAQRLEVFWDAGREVKASQDRNKML